MIKVISRPFLGKEKYEVNKITGSTKCIRMI